MTYLLLQTYLLLLSAYFAGALSACLAKRSMLARSAQMAGVTARTAAIETIEQTEEIVPLAKPREIDPVQPRIEILPRPARKVVPTEAQVDITRFNRALTGPELNEGMPRKMLVEIRPAILKSPTGPAKPFKKPEPKVEAPKAEPSKPAAPSATAQAASAPKTEPAKADTAKPEAPKSDAPKSSQSSTPSDEKPAQAAAAADIKSAAAEPKKDVTSQSATPSSPPSSAMSAGIAGASAAAAAAVAAAKAAAAAVVPRPVQPAPAPQKPAAETKPVEPAKPPAPAPSPAAVEKPATAPAPITNPQQSAAPKPADMQPAAKPLAPAPPPATAAQPAASPTPVSGPKDDLLRIRAIDPETERRLQSIGVARFEHIAHWTPADINRINQAIGLGDRIDREQWIEQAQILAKGGETYYSRNRASTAKPNVATAAAPSPAPAANPQPAATPAATAVAPAKPASEPAPAPAAPAPQPSPQSQAPAAAAPAAPAPNAPPANAQPVSAAATALQGKSVAEMATAAAAAIAAASASVTRGIRPIEPISPLTRANPNIVMPAKLSDALKDNESKALAQPAASSPPKAVPGGKTDDLKRIRGVGVLIEKRLNALGVTTYSQVANWTSGDIDRISQTLDFKGRIERENWVEQARILSSGGQTEFSRRVDRGDVETSRDEAD